MKIITGYADAREEKDVIEFIIEICGKRYKLKESNDGKIRINSGEGSLIMYPEASNSVEIDQKT